LDPPTFNPTSRFSFRAPLAQH
jgi:hypothetical protein